MTSQYEVFDETLNGKLLHDILEFKDINALADYMVIRATDGFREPYVRLLLSKLPTLEEQIEVFEKIFDYYRYWVQKITYPPIERASDEYYDYLYELEVLLKVKCKKLEPDPALLAAVYLWEGSAYGSGHDITITCICGEWALVEGPFSTYAYNWVEHYEFKPLRANIEDDFLDIYNKEWGATYILFDLFKLIEHHPKDLYFDDETLIKIKSYEHHYALYVADKEPSEEHVIKRVRILNSYKRYFDAPSLPRPQEDTAALQSRCDTLKAENAALRQRCEALEAEVESLNANRPSRSSALTDALKSFFKDENEDVETFLKTIEGKDGEEVTDFVRSVYRAKRFKDKMHSSPLYYTLHSHGYYTKSKQNWDQQLAKK